MRFTSRCLTAIAALLTTTYVQAEFTRNIMLTGYWRPTNVMIERFSTDPELNPGDWIGGDWEGRGYDIHSFFPQFPAGDFTKGEGDFEVDYQDTSADFWRIVGALRPIAIITFSRGSYGPLWELEGRQRNLESWADDFEEPRQPTPAPPDDSVPAGYIRYSSLPMQDIADDVNASGLGLNAFIDDSSEEFGGGYLSEFIAYHGTWYHDLHADPDDASWNIAAGHVHVGTNVGSVRATTATEITLRALTGYLDTQIPDPAGVVLLAAGVLMLRRVRRAHLI